MVIARFLIVFSAALILFLGIWLIISILCDRPYFKHILLILVGFYALVCVFSLLFSIAGI